MQSSPDTASIRTNIFEFAEINFKLPYCVNIKLYFEFYIIFLFCSCNLAGIFGLAGRSLPIVICGSRPAGESRHASGLTGTVNISTSLGGTPMPFPLLTPFVFCVDMPAPCCRPTDPHWLLTPALSGPAGKERPCRTTKENWSHFVLLRLLFRNI